jgi:tRNA(adenine34) deaminase
MNEDYVKWMRLAICQAKAAENKGEVPIGAVMVSQTGELLSKAHNETILQNDPTAHAEILTIRKAAEQLRNYRLLNTTLYVTVEPCVMCMGAIIHARIAKLVYAARDPKWGACGSLYDFSTDCRFNHRVKVIGGVGEEESKCLIQGFFKAKRVKIFDQ